MLKGKRVGRYQLEEELGRGAMGVVYRAEDTVIRRAVALKIVRSPGPKCAPADREAYARFLREAHAAGTLLHPNVVTVFDVGEDPTHGVSYIAMEFVRGEPLDHVLRQHEALAADRVRSIGLQVLAALELAHAAGIVHRDIKPANLILAEGDLVKVGDFGIAKLASAEITHENSLLGSPFYMSPEQVRSARVDPRSDLFSLGAVLYELATGAQAFPGGNAFEVIQRVVSDRPRPPRDIKPELPADLEAVILKALAKKPEERFADATEMRRALEGTAGDDASPVSRVPDAGEHAHARALPAWMTPTGGWRRAHLMAALAVLVVAGALAMAAIVGEGGDDSWTADASTRAIDAEPTAAETNPTAVSGEPLEGPGELETSTAEPDARASNEDESPTDQPRRAAPAGTGAAVSDRARESGAGAQDLAGLASPAAKRSVPVATSPADEPLEVAVRHKHRLGACYGVLRVHETFVEYDSSDRDKDDQSWQYDNLERFAFDSNGRLEFTVLEGEPDAGKVKRRNFKFESAGMAAEVVERLSASIRVGLAPEQPADEP